MTSRVDRLSRTIQGGASIASCLGLLAAALVSAAIPTTASAATWRVTNCSPDANRGSLADAIDQAADGDTIDLSALRCTRIVLAGNAITIPQASLHFVGPGRDRLRIDGDGASSIFRHTGGGLLWISDLTFARGMLKVDGVDGRADGGCLYSAGSIRLDRSSVHDCSARGYYAAGGGIFASSGVSANDSSIYANEAIADASASGGGIWSGGAGTAELDYSQVFGNRVSTGTSNIAYGGGVRAYNLAMHYSILADNRAETAVATGGAGGGAYVDGVAEIDSSTVVRNIAEDRQGGVGGSQISIANSTLSGNRAPVASAVGASDLSLYYSTVAFNDGFSAACAGSAAVTQNSRYGVANLFSSILANNTCDGQPAYDLAAASDVTAGSNLVTASRVALPPDTIQADPMLATLADNGGFGLTHALKAGSPAIDAGANDFSEVPQWDQRGPGFPRLKGAYPDIGAYEY